MFYWTQIDKIGAQFHIPHSCVYLVNYLSYKVATTQQETSTKTKSASKSVVLKLCVTKKKVFIYLCCMCSKFKVLVYDIIIALWHYDNYHW